MASFSPTHVAATRDESSCQGKKKSNHQRNFAFVSLKIASTSVNVGRAMTDARRAAGREEEERETRQNYLVE